MDQLDTSNDKSVLEELEIERPLPAIQPFADIIKNPPPVPKVLLEGLLHKGSKMMLASNSKGMKTWNLMNLALSVAAGVDWLGFNTNKGKVLYVNMELQDWSIPTRMNDIVMKRSASVNLAGALQNIHFWNLRGHGCDITSIRPKLEDQLHEGYDLMVVDPIYKLMGGRDENSAGDIGDMLNELERFAMKAQAAVVFAHHFAKGNAAGKDAIDRASGSGVWGRDPDCIFSLTQHEEDGCFTAEPVVRHFAKPEPFVVRWTYPVFVKDDQVDAGKLRGAGGRPQNNNDDNVKTVIRKLFDDERENNYRNGFVGLVDLSFSKLKRGVMTRLEVSDRTASRIITKFTETVPFMNKNNGKYTLSQVNGN